MINTIDVDTKTSYGLDYINNNFVFNRRYFSKRNNKIYYKKLIVIYLKTIMYTLKWYREALEKTYAPGGKGYFEARYSFENNYNKLHN